MLNFIIFCSGALLMVLEMVGARVMAPYLGTSAVIWTSLIGVVLACLAGGAYLGGKLADKRLSLKILSQILTGAGIGCLITATFHSIIGLMVVQSVPNIYLAAVVASIFIFAFPATLFGMVSPYIIRLSLADLTTAGSTVGRLYALSTLGSILGTFLGGFILISWFSSTHILFAVSAIVFLLSFLVYGKKPALRIALLLGFPVTAWINMANTDWLATQGMPAPIESPYNSIRIMEARTYNNRMVRVMATDPGYAQSGMYLDDPTQLYFEYTKFYALGTLILPKAKQILMLGGGGYSVPKWLLAGKSGLESNDFKLDVVELDPKMTDIAHKYFALPKDTRLTIYHEDARRFINSNTQKYDLLFVDVFNSHYSIPFHVGTIEAAKAMHNALAEDGALLMNIISALEGTNAVLFQAIYASMASVFEEIHIFAVEDKNKTDVVQNIMLFAFSKKLDDSHIFYADNIQHLPNNMQKMLTNRITKHISHTTPPLVDDFAPVERYTQILLKNR